MSDPDFEPDSDETGAEIGADTGAEAESFPRFQAEGGTTEVTQMSQVSSLGESIPLHSGISQCIEDVGLYTSSSSFSTAIPITKVVSNSMI